MVDDEKLLKIGLGLGKGDLRVEGNFQMGWHRRCNKKYKCRNPVDPESAEPLIPAEPSVKPSTERLIQDISDE